MTEDWREAKRALGNGRWDRVLKTNMVALSKADNYDDLEIYSKIAKELHKLSIDKKD
jgi:hypothetical protein